MINLTEKSFEQEVLKSNIPVLVDFWAEWCGPCKMLTPIIDELDKEYENRIKICKLDVDSCSKISAKYSVFSIPTVIIFKNGSPVEKLIGVQTKKNFTDKLDQLIS